MGSEFFDRNYASLLLFYGELEEYKEKGTLFRINEVINEEIAHTNSKMIIQRIQKREDKDKLSSECDVLLNSIINEELQSKFIQLLENIELDENLTVHIRSLVVLYRMVTKFIPSNSSEIISISDYKSFHSEGNQLKINNAFVNEYFKNTLLAYKEFISAVQKVSILDIKEDARIEYIKLIFQEYLETLLLLSKFEQFDENVFEENSVSNFAKDFNALNKKFKDYFNKCLSDIGITEKIEKDLPELYRHGALKFLLYGFDESDNQSKTSAATDNASADSGKEYVKLPEKFYPDLKDLLPNFKDIMNAKVLRLVINVIFNNFIEMEDTYNIVARGVRVLRLVAANRYSYATK
ncbi:uncharacterized protein LOC114123236 isoform X18 [Aphis gossypii]|uniref:uncharacterized protein LOC114123236 isoform X16 n=1 Tax=Aphis gossypii TaxID=80765 RepID=UPI002158E05E|nr:uncharacterized protein LOC114123236 isoform X16 [Aphis gossypii]XP_050060473.1 uncharacterized protein LOC114123236 isoform X17 [Aphis gossypii]XP_050060474.1 uncharacterized protein LOC114123236 isoform X18 [Aphis gossypii]